MKKLHLLFGVLIIVGCLQTYAAKSGVYMDFYKYGHEDKNTTVHRFPMRIPINVYYDNELRQIEISGSVDIDVQIFLCDENGNIIAYSSIPNTNGTKSASRKIQITDEMISNSNGYVKVD